MFDTSVVRAHSTAARHPLALLTLSAAFHVLAVVAALLVSLTATSLPLDPPRQAALYHPQAIPTVPPPAGNPNVQRPAQQPAASAQTVQRPAQLTAPNLIPNETPVLADRGTTGSIEAPPGSASDGWGVPDGDPFSVGESSTATVEVPQAAPPAPLWPRGEVHSARVLSRVEPRYPQVFAGARLRNVTVVVRCVIDRHGQLRDAQVVHGQYQPFNDAVLEALSQWRFAPGSLRGEAVDTYFELTVNFQVR